MKIKMLKTVLGNEVKRSGREYEVSNEEGQNLIDAGYAMKVQGRETATAPKAENRETANIKPSKQ